MVGQAGEYTRRTKPYQVCKENKPNSAIVTTINSKTSLQIDGLTLNMILTAVYPWQIEESMLTGK